MTIEAYPGLWLQCSVHNVNIKQFMSAAFISLAVPVWLGILAVIVAK
jgi:hypothetical protein